MLRARGAQTSRPCLDHGLDGTVIDQDGVHCFRPEGDEGKTMGLAAYGAAPANFNCDPQGGGGVNCTPAQMAAHDLFVWNQQVLQALPNGQWQLQFNPGTIPPSYTLSVSWDEIGQGQVTHQIVIQVPPI